MSCIPRGILAGLLLSLCLAGAGGWSAARASPATARGAHLGEGTRAAGVGSREVTPLACLAIGDSLTWDMFAAEPQNGYFPRLVAWLAAHGLPAANRLALPYGTVADAAALAPRISDMPAALVVVELGNNDAPVSKGATPTPPEAFERDYRTVVAAARSANPDARLVMVGLWKQDRLRPVYDAIIRRIAADAGACFVELGALSADPALSGPAGRPTPTGVSDGYHPNDEGHGAIAQLIRQAIAPWYGFDATPPVTRSNTPAGWSRRPITLRLSARATGARVSETRYRIDGGPWREGTRVRVSGDRVHTVRFYSVDALGNTESLRTCKVRIDAERPLTEALRGARAIGGETVRLPFRLVEAVSPVCLVRLEVSRAGVLVRRVRIGRLQPGRRAVTWRCDLQPGAYRYRFLATDLAGNTQAEALAATLFVR